VLLKLGAAQRAKFYKRPPTCDNTPSIPAKRQFEEAFPAGRL